MAHGRWGATLTDPRRGQSTQLDAPLTRALLFDVDRQSRSALEVVLAQRGFEVLACHTRAEFWARLHDTERAVVALGLNGGAQDDQDLLNRVTAIASERGLPLLVISGGAHGTPDHGYTPPLLATLPRPVPIAALRAALAAIEGGAFAEPLPVPPLSEALVPQTPVDVELLTQGVDLFVVLDTDLRISTGGPLVARELGSPLEGLEGAPLSGFVHPADWEQFARDIAALDLPGAGRNSRVRLSDADGEWREYDLRVTRRPADLDVGAYLLVGLETPDHASAAAEVERMRAHLAAFVDSAPLAVFSLDEQLRISAWSDSARLQLGWEADELVGRAPEEWVFVDGDQRVALADQIRAIALDRRSRFVFKTLARARDGNLHEIEWYCSVHRATDGAVLSATCMGLDVSEQRMAEEVLRRSEERFRSLVQYSSDMLMVLDAEGHVIYSSPAAEQLLGEPPNGRIGQYAFSDVHPDDLPATQALLARALERPDAVIAGEFRVRGRDGEWRDVECRVRNLLTEPSVQGIVLNARDVTERRQAEHASRASEERFRSLVQNASDMVTVIDEDGLISYQSPSIERILGYTPAEVEQRRLTEFMHPDDAARALSDLERIVELERGTVRFEARWRHANDTFRQVEALCTNLTADPSVRGIVVNARDVTERKSLERQLTRRAFLDSLTNLPNRLLFLHRLDRALQRAGGATHSVGVLFLDLDRFKVVNDSLGHEIGDQLLIAVAQRLRRIVRPADTVARLGGDEFIVLIEGAQQLDEVVRVAERIIEGLGSPVRLNRHEVTVAASVGIAIGDGPSVSSQDLLRNADIALYRAKEQGSGQFVVFDASMAHQAVERLALENDLRRAVQRNEFRVHYLPEMDLSTGQLAGLEVLVRWMHPERGLVRPTEFIPVAEETGLIVPIGEWALRQACEQMRFWQDTFPQAGELQLALNLTAHEFQRHDLVDHITSTLREAGLEPGVLRLEISEAIMVAEPRSAFDKLRRLKECGIKLAIDDFGSGYSSLSYLTRVSFDTLKIDRQFVSGPGGVTSNLSIVRAVTSLAHALGMSVTAEGIESREHLTRVRAAGCDYGQGFLFSDALEAEEVELALFNRPPNV